MSKYPLDPEFGNVEDLGCMRVSIETHREQVRMHEEMCRDVHADNTTVLEEDVVLEGYRSARIGARIFAPSGVTDEMPCLVDFHGGGFFLPWGPHHLKHAMHYARELSCKVILINYRTCLDDPFPTPVEDCYAGLKWVYDNAKTLGIDPAWVAVCGDSAGGALAAAVCQMARDRGLRLPCFQMLIYPVTDSSQNTESVAKFRDTPCFNATGNEDMWEMYLRNGDFGMPQYAAPMLAEDLSGLPGAYVEVCEFDCLHDEGVAYAHRLLRAGVPVELNEAKGAYHGYDDRLELHYVQRMLERRVNALRRAFYGG